MPIRRGPGGLQAFQIGRDQVMTLIARHERALKTLEGDSGELSALLYDDVQALNAFLSCLAVRKIAERRLARACRLLTRWMQTTEDVSTQPLRVNRAVTETGRFFEQEFPKKSTSFKALTL